MANTFLNTPGMATNNPVANVNGTNTNTVANVNTPVNQTTAIAPVAIPVQFEPQVATSITNTQQPIQPNMNLQTQQQNVVTAPIPQTYQNNNTNNNVVDFNQIYSAYQGQYGNPYNTNNTNNQIASGIKKTSLGTTIVTPTTNNLNSVEGQYQSAYSDTINTLISEVLNQYKSGFTYNPLEDNSLKIASEYAANSTLQSLAGSGVLNSSATAERVARIVSELIPTYEEKAHNRWTEYLGQLADTAQLVMNYDAQEFQYWKDAKDREFEEKEFEYKKLQDSLENAWKRVDELGYVDNNASTILGVPVGTLSSQARLQKEQQEFELQKMREQLEIEQANNVALYKLKNELETEQSKILADYNAAIERNLYSYKSNIDAARNKDMALYQSNLDKGLYSYKSSIDTAASKDLAKYQSNLDRSLYNYKSSVDTARSKELANYQSQLDKDLYGYKSNIDNANEKDLYSYKSNIDNASQKDLYNYKSNIDNANEKDLYNYKSAIDTANERSLYDYKSSVDNASQKDLYSYKSAIDSANDRSLYNYKSAIDTAASKELADYNNSLSNSSKEFEYQLANKYGTNSTTSLSTYDDVIKNRWVNYDDVNKKYTITDNASAYNYIKSENQAGRMTANDAQALMNKYNILPPVELHRSGNLLYFQKSDGRNCVI